MNACRQRRRLRAAATVVAVAVGALAAGCASAPATSPPSAPTEPNEPAAAAPSAAALEPVLREERQHLAEERVRSIELEQELLKMRAELAAAEERYEALAVELETTLEEVLRSKASVRSVQSRALATSRIAEVRVAMQSVEPSGAPMVETSLARATELLTRADKELADGNYGGAAYLAERASDLVRQARTAREVMRVPTTAAVEALLPPLNMRTTRSTNVRQGPATTFERVSVLPPGARVLAVAASEEWRHVESDTGIRGWVHSSLLSADAERAETLAADSVRLITTTAVNLREGPGTDYDRIATLAAEEAVRGLAKIGDWYRVERSNGNTGWVHTNYLRAAGDDG